MRRLLTAILFLTALVGNLHAQANLRMANDRLGSGGDIPTFNQQGLVSGRDSTVTDRSTPHDVKMFRVSPVLGDIIPIATDTATFNFQNLHFADGLNGEYNYLGNMGSPRLSRIFFNRQPEGQFLFTDAMDFFLISPGEFNFSNTKSPYSNITYYRAGNKVNGEEWFKGYYGVNAN